MYSFKSRVRYSEVGYNNKITLTSIIDYFQDCSTFQSEDVGLSMDSFYEINRSWLLSSWQIIINEYPSLSEDITISTWPYHFKGLYGYRNFTMENDKGEVLAYANSIWVYINLESGLPTRIDMDMAQIYGLEEKLNMDYAPRKISIPDNLESFESFPVVRANIDTNKHVNNGQYVLMGEQLLPENFKTRQIRADYRNAAKLGDIIVPKIAKLDDAYIVVLSDPDGNPYTTLEFKQ